MSVKKNFEIKFFKLGILNSIIWFANFIITYVIAATIYFIFAFGTVKILLFNSRASAFTVDLFNIIIILISALGLIYISLILTSFIVTSKNYLIKWIFISVEILAFSVAVVIWVSPQLLINFNSIESRLKFKEMEFTFGPYPGNERFSQLKKEGYSAVISLMHPEIIPFESRLLEEEIKTSREVGIKIISIPILPRSDLKEDILKSFYEKFDNVKGKFYVHEFNGEGRVNLFMNNIESRIKEMAAIEKNNLKKLTETKFFEKGEIIKLDDGIYFTPYPNEKEILDFIVTPKVKSVVCFVNEKNTADTSILNKEKKILETNSIPFIIKSFTEQPYDPSVVFESSLFVRGLPRPVVIHTFDLKSVISEGFILTYKNQKRSFPPSLFSQPLQNGKTALVLPNVLAGPKPTLGEYKTRLFNYGVRGIIYCDTVKKFLSVSDKTFFSKIGLSWEQIELTKLSSNKEIINGGLWYIYGADSLTIREHLK